MNDRTNHGSSHYCGCRDGRGNCDRVVTAAAAVVAPSAVVTTAMVVVVDVDVDVAVDVDIVIYVDVSINVGASVDIGLRAATVGATTATLGEKCRS